MGPVPWKELPFYTINKAFALSSFILLSFNFSLGPMKNIGIRIADRWLNSRKVIGGTGFVLAVAHSLISVLIFTPAYFQKFFTDENTLTLNAGLSMLAGVFSLIILWGYNASFQTYLRENEAFIKFITSRNFLLAAFVLGGLHLFFMGYESWFNAAVWHGGLPPITMIGFAFFILAFGFNLLGRK